MTFESIEFGGPFDARRAERWLGDARRALRGGEPAPLADHAHANILALAQRRTPNYFLFGVSDDNVSGLILSVRAPGQAEPLQFVQFSMRPGVPLQSTLFRLCELAAQTLSQTGQVSEGIRVGVTVLYDPAMHGTVAQPDLRGLDPSRRALLLSEQEKSAWVFTPSESAEGLLGKARDRIDVLLPEGAALYSLAADSTEPEVVFHSAPQAVSGRGSRPPARAGQFYPADPAELATMVETMLGETTRREESWPAAMVPHAGLRYSGKIAASVFNRLEIPDQVIIIGPKHTRLGVDWAVSPHESWSIPGATIPGDPDLANALVEAIPGLKLDAAAHQQEHAIEVELPFLAKLAPNSRVVGITIGGGNLERCRDFARGLAEVIRSLPKKPLLIISSDMNHFATDGENRRLDEIALGAMERLDPADLLETVTSHNISMCGVLPAVIVMETLRQLGTLTKAERVGYATSADVTGDPSRVVGYAGMLLS